MAQLAPAFGWWIWVGDAQQQLGTFGFRTSYGEDRGTGGFNGVALR